MSFLRTFIFLAAVGAVLWLPRDAQAITWSTVTIEPGRIGNFTSLAVDANGDPMISQADFGVDLADSDLTYMVCNVSSSADGNCSQAADWRKATVDAVGMVASTSIALGAQGDPMIAYHMNLGAFLNFAICDISASLNANCDQANDWRTVTVETDAGGEVSIAVRPNGDPVISYRDLLPENLKFAICDISASVTGSCDSQSDWRRVTVAAGARVGASISVAVGGNGNPVISYSDGGGGPQDLDLKFAICDISASITSFCDSQLSLSYERRTAHKPRLLEGRRCSRALAR